jgi:hypothetical protein
LYTCIWARDWLVSLLLALATSRVSVEEPSGGLLVMSPSTPPIFIFILLLCCLFNDASNSDYIASNDQMLTTHELERML